MDLARLSRRFSFHDGRAFDHWHREELIRTSVANTPENLLMVSKIFGYRSSLIQNIVDFRQNHFEIDIVTQPFSANGSRTLSSLSATRAEYLQVQLQALWLAAREWGMDFIDFGRFQVLPCASLRFAWNLQTQQIPAAVSFPSIFKTTRRRNATDQVVRLGKNGKQPEALPAPLSEAFLYRSDDFAVNILHSHAPGAGRANADLKVRINVQNGDQGRIIQDILFHHLHATDVLFVRAAGADTSLRGLFAAASQERNAEKKAAAELAREFSLSLEQSVFRRAVLVIDGLQRQEDGEFLGFLSEAGGSGGVTIIVLNDTLGIECDLELNEAPIDPLQKYLPERPLARAAGRLHEREKRLLDLFAFIGAPVPIPAVNALAGPGNESWIRSLLKKNLLQENRQTLSVKAAAGAVAAASAGEERDRLSALAAKSDWPYLRIRHCLAEDRLAELERLLRLHARLSPQAIAPGPAAELILRHLPRLAKNQALLCHFLKILASTGAADLAEKLFAAHAEADSFFSRLSAAHLAWQRRDYQKLGTHLAGMGPIPESFADECRFLNFIYNEKTAESAKADAFAKKIRDPYYRHLMAIQLSDRNIYSRDFTGAESRLAAAEAFFSRQRCHRQEIEIQSQQAKLQREKGCLAAAESLYKTLFVSSASGGYRLNAAFSAVDLGNLYLDNGDDFSAEGWYRKALRLFESEKNNDGIMLVNANLINIHAASGNWNEAERLVRTVLAHSQGKKSLLSCAIDYLNWAGLEQLRLNHGRSLQLIARARQIFEKTGNRRGLGECAVLEAKIGFAEEKAVMSAAPEAGQLSNDQRALWRLCQLRGLAGDGKKAESAWKQLAAIESKRTRFDAMALVLRQAKKKEWLAPFMELSRELSARGKNYFFHEYWYVHFELDNMPEPLNAQARECFLAMHDFFSMNKRRISPKLNRLREMLEEGDSQGLLFDGARLVGQFRQWRLPEDFFASFLHEIGQALPLDWLAMHIYENGELRYRFSNSDMFRELGEEMLRHSRLHPGPHNFRLEEIRAKFGSRERFFYPFANTKMARWQIGDRFSADLVAAFRSGDAYFQNFFERNRDLLKNFAALFQSFFANELRVQKKLEFIVGSSEAIKEMKRLIAQISMVDFSLLISGESGSGKELAAKAVHALGRRAGRPFIAVNAAALPEALLEAELFGFRKGAFSGAVENRIGLLEAADGGTLFLDEIADLPLSLQAKLLRVLQEREIRRLGENKTVPVDIRLISASNQDLKGLIGSNQFRADLYYRLQDLTLHIPPLRERREDIPELIAHFLKKFGLPAIDRSRLQHIADRFQDEHFPGNVRELESKIKNLITFNPGLEHVGGAEKKHSTLRASREKFERSLLLGALNDAGWNRIRAAAGLGISRMALFNLMKKHQVGK